MLFLTSSMSSSERYVAFEQYFDKLYRHTDNPIPYKSSPVLGVKELVCRCRGGGGGVMSC